MNLFSSDMFDGEAISWIARTNSGQGLVPFELIKCPKYLMLGFQTSHLVLLISNQLPDHDFGPTHSLDARQVPL